MLVPPGLGPFRQKGHGYLGDFAYFDEVIAGGTAAVIAEVPLAPVRSFLQQKFWGPDWFSSIYFEYAKVETAADGPKLVSGSMRRIPGPLAQFTVFGGVGFTEETLRLAGAAAPRVEVGSVEPDGEAHGQPLFRIAVRIAWS